MSALGNSVPTRFVMFVPPTFCTAKFTVTVSPGSMIPFVGTQDSAASVVPAAAGIGFGEIVTL